MEGRKEEMEKKQDEKSSMGNKAREVIREAIISISDSAGDAHGNDATSSHNNLKPEDVLAYSRTVQKTDSSLE